MSSLIFKIDAKNAMKALNKAPVLVMTEVRKQLGNDFNAMKDDAVQNHRFQSRSFAAGLEGAVQTDVEHDASKAKLYIDDDMAIYGQWVHDGHHSWRPDRFVKKAFVKGAKKLNANISKAINRGLKKAGLE